MASSWSLTLTPALTEKLIKADERKLKHILFNLLSNAVKFTSEGGAVRIRAENDREFFRIAVADTGIGIRREELGRIWGEMALAEEKKRPGWFRWRPRPCWKRAGSTGRSSSPR